MMEVVLPYLLYAGAIGFPSFFVLRWIYSQWWKANLPAFWAWVLQQRRRDKMIRETREKVTELDRRLIKLDEKIGGSAADQKNEENDGITESLENALIRLGNVERMIAQLRHRLRSKGILIDG